MYSENLLTEIHGYDIVYLKGGGFVDTHENIKALRKQLGLSQEELAIKVGYTDRSSVAKIEAGLVDLTQSKIAAFAAALGVSPAQLMGVGNVKPAIDPPALDNILPMPKTYKVPLVGSIACGKPILAVEDADETVDVPEWVHADFALRCKGDSMITARIFDGDIVYIKSQPEVAIGQIAAVRIGEEATLKKVYYTPSSGRLILRACNPLYDDMVYTEADLDEVEILGLAVGFYSTFRHEQ